MFEARLKLTEAENDFFRLMVYRSISDMNYGQPYLKSAFFRLIPVSVTGSSTMSINQDWYVFIDFAEMMEKGVDYAVGILNHEVWHPLRSHFQRFEELPSPPNGYNKDFLANIAGDLEINDDIEEILPSIAVKPKRGTFREYEPGQVMLEYYNQMLDDLDNIEESFPQVKSQPKPKNPQKGDSPNKDDNTDDSSSEGDSSSDSQDSDSGQNSQSGSGDPSDSKDGQSSEGEAGKGQGEGQGSPSDTQNPSSGNSASGTDSNSSPSQGGSEEGSGKPNFWEAPNCGIANHSDQEYDIVDSEEFPEPQPVTEEDLEALAKNIEADIEEFKEKLQSKGVGSSRSKMLNKVSAWAKNKLKAKHIPWKQELRGHFTQAYATVRGKTMHIRNKPARRQPLKDFIYPALGSPKPTLGIGIDVSGSNVGNLRVILEELNKILSSVGVRGREVKAFAVDVKASVHKTVSNPLTLLDDLPVGGGTRMAPGYRKLAELGQDISILFTDGYVDDYPKVKPKGRKNTIFITGIIIDTRHGKDMSVIKKAKSQIGSWSKIVPIFVEDVKPKV